MLTKNLENSQFPFLQNQDPDFFTFLSFRKTKRFCSLNSTQRTSFYSIFDPVLFNFGRSEERSRSFRISLRNAFSENVAFMCSPSVSETVEGLSIERDRLENAVSYLLKSNKEMKEILTNEGPDRDLRDAIGENIVVIAKYRGQIERLNQEIRKSRGETVDVTLSQTYPVQRQETASSPSIQNAKNEDPEEPTLWM